MKSGETGNLFNIAVTQQSQGFKFPQVPCQKQFIELFNHIRYLLIWLVIHSVVETLNSSTPWMECREAYYTLQMSYIHNFCIDILLQCKIIKVLLNIISQ